MHIDSTYIIGELPMKNLVSLIAFLVFTTNVFASGVVEINGKTIKSREELHKKMAKDLNFPTYYGANLDALYEVLVNDYSGESVIKIKYFNFLRKRIGSEYTQNFLEAISEASIVNPRVVLIIE